MTENTDTNFKTCYIDFDDNNVLRQFHGDNKCVTGPECPWSGGCTCLRARGTLCFLLSFTVNLKLL